MQPQARHRPERTYKTGAVTRMIRWFSLAVALAASALLLVGYPQMPNEVPIHFDAAGQPDAYGDKMVVLGVACGIILVQLVMYWASKKPQIMDYPARVTDENAQRLYREGERFFVYLGLSISTMTAGVGALYSTDGSTVGSYLVWISLAAMAVIAITGVVRMRHASKPESESGFHG